MNESQQKSPSGAKGCIRCLNFLGLAYLTYVTWRFLSSDVCIVQDRKTVTWAIAENYRRGQQVFYMQKKQFSPITLTEALSTPSGRKMIFEIDEADRSEQSDHRGHRFSYSETILNYPDVEDFQVKELYQGQDLLVFAIHPSTELVQHSAGFEFGTYVHVIDAVNMLDGNNKPTSVPRFYLCGHPEQNYTFNVNAFVNQINDGVLEEENTCPIGMVGTIHHRGTGGFCS